MTVLGLILLALGIWFLLAGSLILGAILLLAGLAVLGSDA